MFVVKNMENLKWIYFVILFTVLQSGGNTQMMQGGPIHFPNSNENMQKTMKSFNYPMPSLNSNTMGTKTFSSSRSSSRSSAQEPLMNQYSRYNTGSGSSAQAGSYQNMFNQPMSPQQMSPQSYNIDTTGQRPGGSSSYAQAGSFSSSSNFAGCNKDPNPILNAQMKCTSSQCKAQCLPDYQFPSKLTSMTLNCINGQWTIKNSNSNDIPICEPICLPACQNNGICIAPGQCQCPDNYHGSSCQNEKKFCLEKPPMSKNSKISCTSAMCTVTCMTGNKFPDNSQTMNLQCANGKWIPKRQDLMIIPDCEPICNPQCQNGGSCLSYNVCQCMKTHRGPQCQYSIDRCNPSMLNFNGAYNCSGTGDVFNCNIFCPQGINLEYEAARIYSCNYADGQFLPRNVPQCVLAPGMKIIRTQITEGDGYKEGIKSSTKTNTGKNITIVVDDGYEPDEIQEEVVVVRKKVVIPGKKKNKTITFSAEEEQFFQAPGVNYIYESVGVNVEGDSSVTHIIPKAASCMTWNGNKVTTFDGVTYSYDLACSHTLVEDYIDGTFHIILRSCPFGSPQPCAHALEVFIQREQYTFEKINGVVKMFTTKKQISIPTQISGLKVSRSGVDIRIILEAIPITIVWNSDKFVQIEASPSIWNRTAGLCGTMDGILTNDFMSKDRNYHKLASVFVDSWKALNLDKNKDQCQPKSQQYNLKCETSVEEKANLVCTDLYKNRKMENCLKMYNEKQLMETCISDYCDCKNTYERTQCICNGFSALARDCQFNGIMLADGWRDWQICPLNCTNGRVYRSCGPINEPSCGSAIEDNQYNCREGCFCPDNTMLYDGTCVKQEQCPCKLKGKTFPPKSEITRDCNTCTCRNGVWACTSLTCGSRCAAIGDPHYVTFDGKKYDFMGKCSYYLMQTDDMTVEAENVVCSGAISENMNLLPSFSSELPSCTKSLTIKFKDNGKMKTIKLKQGGYVLIDGFEVTKLPKEMANGGVKIIQASSTFILVDFQDGVRVWWDGITRAYIDAPASYRGKTKGLCGTFNANMKDDFLTPEGDIETAVSPFANKWQTKESCEHVNNDIVPHPCQANIEMKDKADKICSKIKEKVFEECHWLVDPESFFIDCLFDVCACKGDINHCGCPILAAYAAECTRQGTVLNWRHKVTECNVNCPLGQIFDQCGEPYTRTCTSLQSETLSKLQCVEGCRCPQGQALDENNECVTVAMCKCTYKNMEFKPGHKEVRAGKKTQQLCTCTGAKWICVDARPDDPINYPPASDMLNKCAATKNEVFTTCEPANPITCKNMHTYMQSSTAVCRPGCTCKEGFVLDSILKLCVLPEKCSCHHGGKSYNDGETMKEECNTCVCKAGSWECSQKSCGSTCSSWGDSHFQTFDGREFDFQGVCNYVLSKGKLADNDGFSVTIQNVLCGSNGVTCSKSLDIAVVGLESEAITLSSDQAGYKSKSGNALKKIFVHRSGIFLVVEIPHIGVLIKWDRGTRVYVKLESRWKGNVQGLCGNYNYDSKDDFMNPSSGVEQNPIIFGHSWKLDDSCPTPTEQADACELHPERNIWAQRKCGLLKSSVFAPCHSEVPIDSFWKRCIFDTCSCDQGGDCECLCTALSAYAYACSVKGVNIKWRTPDLCPMQCDPTCSSYSPCIPSCSVETCDNLLQQSPNERMCKEDTCVEGCALKGCENGMVYKNDSYTECVPKSICKPVCLLINGITYYEGDTITTDSCHTCSCTRGRKKCIGEPCAPRTLSTPAPALSDGNLNCISGWSGWFNQDVLDQSAKQTVKTSKSNYFKEDDIEPLPTDMQMKNIPGNGNAVCPSKMIAAVECRTVMDHKSPKATSQNVECSLERGLYCQGQCFDYEIRVLCDCGDNEMVETTTKPRFIPPVYPVIPPSRPTKNYIKLCDPSIPHIEHPFSCSKFLHCLPATNGSWIYAEKTCGDSMMYNPISMTCDWPENVKAMKPKCQTKPEEPEYATGDFERIVRECPAGFVFSDCALPCGRTCHYYGQSLKLAGNCTAQANTCKPGCIPMGSVANCQYPKLWRDPTSCVSTADCTCMAENFQQLKPGEIVKISDCKTCQCINNEVICVETPCSKNELVIGNQVTESPITVYTIAGGLPPPENIPNVPKTMQTRPCYLTLCDTSIPHVEHPLSCYKFLHCHPAPNGSWVFAEKTCGPDMMFNPVHMICDWPANVIAMKPNCETNPGETELFEKCTEEQKQVPTTRRPAILVPPTRPQGRELTPPPPTRSPTPVTPSFVSPPMQCDQSQMVPLMDSLPDSALTASSFYGPAFRPEAGRLNSKATGGSSGSWSPSVNDQTQYLQIQFPQLTPLYGVIVRGSIFLDQYVTSFKILHSFDGQSFHYLLDEQQKIQIFSGSVDQTVPVKSFFKVPIEAKVVRIYPITWHESISMKAELLGCKRGFDISTVIYIPIPTTPRTFVTPRVTPTKEIFTQRPPVTQKPFEKVPFTDAPVIPMCDEPLGVESNQIVSKQITFSSIKDPGTVKTKVRNNPNDVIKLSSPRGWMPLATSSNEFVKFDFLGNRNLTGVITKGGEYGWVKSFNILYSKDNKIWNVLSANGKPFEFLGNVDADTPKKTLFKHPISAQFLKIRPVKWFTAIEMKIEPLGCFEPYQKQMELTTKNPNQDVEIVTPSTCGVCKNVLPPVAPVMQDTCTCYLPLQWNGQECVPQLQCPCMVGHMAYEVGVQFATEDCADCICKLGGESHCTPKVCEPCKQGTKRAAPETCSCKCEKCPVDTILCQSSGQCIPEESWCDGVIDCPDEINCVQKGTITTTTNTTTTILKQCPEIACPPGFEVKPIRSRKPKMTSRFSDSSEDDDDVPIPTKTSKPQLYYIKANYQASYEAVLPISISAKGQNINEEECYRFMCVPVTDTSTDYMEEGLPPSCPSPRCPNGYTVKLQDTKTKIPCAQFSCEPFLENDAVCNVTGRTINTFDSTEFKYDFCSHLLARDTADIKWNVIVRKNCSGGNNVCTKEVEFKDKTSPYTIILYPTLDVNLDGYPFTVQQLQNSNKKSSFVVSKAGDTLLFVSHAHGVWITFDQYGDIKLGISPKYANQVDGLCGFFNNIKADDKQTPNGKLATSTVEFSESWSLNQISKENCEPHVCPQNLQDVAWKMCNMVNDEIFKVCAKSVDPSRFVSTCIETACDCLKTASNGSSVISPNDLVAYGKTCKCAMLKNYVVECMAADEDVHLETWRSVHGCEANCPAPLVHKDCYRRKCETTCNNIQSNDCTNVPGSCFSGCYCPEGMVRKDSTCVPIAECKDCVCDGFGKSQYLTYDRKNFTFDGNCTYLLTRDLTVENVHTFQVYATIGPCDPKAKTAKKATCTQSLHLIYGSHLVHIQRGKLGNLEVIIDGFNQKKLPYNQNWIQVSEIGKELNIKLPESNVELTSQFDTMSFSIKVPSLKFGNKMEGICGNCNGNPDDDLQINLEKYQMIPDSDKNSETKNFALSWLADEPKLGMNELKCHVDDETDCLPLPPDTDPCFKIWDETLFGKCHFVVDPIMFLTACQQDLCRTGPVQKGACGSIEAYARECARNGICVDWRRNGFCSMECAAPFIYNPCGCLETCDSVEIKNQRLQTSAIRDPTKLANIKATCDTTLSEGCFCPKGKVLRNGKCLFEKECKPCDDQGHFPGDVWHPDMCTDCKCKNDSTISCSTIKCPSQQTICSIGFIAVETAPTGECCKKYSCVPEAQKVKDSCPLLSFPKCNENQMNKMINGTDGCSKYICDCIPKNQCKLPQNYTSLEPGFKKIIDSSGCCPTSKLVCDKSLCPQKPAQCTEAFYVMVTKAKTLNDKICCEIYECQPPPNGCVVTVGGQKYFKKIDEVWTTANPCVLETCAFDTNGNPAIKAKQETCNNICQPGHELKPIPNKCCGVCIKTKCVVDNKIYDVGQGWMSSDNCTKFSCNSKDDQTFIASEMESCPDVSECADALKYIDGCCTKCKIESLQQQNCLAESLSESSTIGLIRTVIPPHGLCKNVKGIRGLTHCSGNCPSGTKFNPLTLLQNKDCHCCSVGSVREMTVPLLCADNVILNKVFSVPSSCSCSVCGNDSDLKNLKLTKATSK